MTRSQQLVRRITRCCLVCFRARITPISAPYAPLPPDKIAELKPYSVTEVDFSGPLSVKEAKTGSSKANIVLFTRATPRAIYLGLVTSLSTQVLLLTFRRFVARREVPDTIYSDNGRAFRITSKDLHMIWEVISQKEINTYFAKEVCLSLQ